MRFVPSEKKLRSPQLLDKTRRLGNYLKTLSAQELEKVMKISPALAKKTVETIDEWNADPETQSLALDSFLGDIYSGLQVQDFTEKERNYADEVLRILSGLYGIIRPFDGICPYRLEMGYKLPEPEFSSLPKYWRKSIVETLPKDGLIVNLASEEYAQTVVPFVETSRVVAPQFLTVNEKNGEPSFVVVHAKIARGAFAHWLIKSRVTKVEDLVQFEDLGYQYNVKLSKPNEPVFVCKEFGGKGLSIKKLASE